MCCSWDPPSHAVWGGGGLLPGAYLFIAHLSLPPMPLPWGTPPQCMHTATCQPEVAYAENVLQETLGSFLPSFTMGRRETTDEGKFGPFDPETKPDVAAKVCDIALSPPLLQIGDDWQHCPYRGSKKRFGNFIDMWIRC